MIKVLLLFFLFEFSYAEITLQEISSKPTSRAKDFLIWQYLKKERSASEIKNLYAQSSKSNYRINKIYKKAHPSQDSLYKSTCAQKRDLFAIEDKECLHYALNPYKTLALNKKEREKLISKVQSKDFIRVLKIQNEPYSAKAYKKYNPTTVLKMFIYTTASHRRENLNINLDKQFINKLTSSKLIHYFIKMVTKDESLDKLQKSLLLLESEKLNANDNFLLALHHLKYNQKQSAIEHLEAAYLKSTKTRELDKMSFWLYQVSQNEKYIERLLLSKSINIYTLYAHDKKNVALQNYFSSLDTDSVTSSMDLTNPFIWEKIRQEIRETPKDKILTLVSKYKAYSLLPVQAIIMEKAYSYQLHGYIMPYDRYLQGVSKDEKALIYAIMRQESQFIPSALSRSFALGLMQIMPFLTDALSKEMKENVDYNDMFNPQMNLKYAIQHLKWMQKSLYHPLFIAYAYNGGMGFLRRHLKTGAFSDAEYEPYLSMELMSNSESREYGKKVLANYVMYKKILGEEISIIHLFEMLKDPKKTDRFRAELKK